MTRRTTKRRTQFKPNGRSHVIAGKRETHGCHWVQDELPS